VAIRPSSVWANFTVTNGIPAAANFACFSSLDVIEALSVYQKSEAGSEFTDQKSDQRSEVGERAEAAVVRNSPLTSNPDF
jgi:hypothetical protein